MKSPFKFLDAFTYEDRNVFFGRESETDTLYQMVFKTPLLLIYGLSGTGKSSLVQCGLASRFDGTDWYPFLIRRQEDINQSLRQSLEKAMPAVDPVPSKTVDIVSYLFRYYLRPVYLIFDQFEELFILGNEKEQIAFGETLRSLIEAELSCKIILVMREEFIGQLYLLERILPTVYDFRLRVEPMGYKKVQEVILRSCDTFNIALEAPEANAQQIYDNISAGKSGVQLPYLQVYLDMLYREDFQRTYPGQAGLEQAGPPFPPLTFSTAEISNFGGIEDLLGRFMEQQELQLEKALANRFANCPTDAAKTLLDNFVTEEGTKRPVRYTRKGDLIELEENIAQWLTGIPKEAIAYLVQQLISARLVRDLDNTLELAHDSLAALIDRRRNELQRRRNETFNRLMNNFREYQETGEFLSRKQLSLLEDYLPVFEDRLNPEVKRFIQDSQSACERLEKAELEAERRKRRTARRVAIGGLFLAFVAISASVFAFRQTVEARRAKAQLAREVFETEIKTGQTYKVEGKYDQALQVLDNAARLTSDLSPEQISMLNQYKQDWTNIKNLVKKAENAREANDLPKTLQYYRDAYRQSSDTYLRNAIENTENEIEVDFNRYVQRGDALKNLRQYKEAANNYQQALNLREEKKVKERLQQVLKLLENY